MNRLHRLDNVKVSAFQLRACYTVTGRDVSALGDYKILDSGAALVTTTVPALIDLRLAAEDVLLGRAGSKDARHDSESLRSVHTYVIPHRFRGAW